MVLALAASRLVILSVVVLVLAGWVLLSRRRRMAKRAAYWSGKAPMSDRELVACFAPITAEQQRFCVAVRKAIAAEMNVDAQVVRPDDQINDYLSLDYTGPLSLAGVEVMKLELGLKPDENFVAGQELQEEGPYLGSRTLGDYVTFYLKNWDRITSPRG
ncbi:MAG: hypothetical protein MUP47_04890 [Phycisphaerae bacterium]|nr:hypothetical protein [Phycisphaerae bacterium]